MVMQIEEAAKKRLLGLEDHGMDDFLPPEASRIHFADMVSSPRAVFNYSLIGNIIIAFSRAIRTP